jgi:hypothetical protein
VEHHALRAIIVLGNEVKGRRRHAGGLFLSAKVNDRRADQARTNPLAATWPPCAVPNEEGGGELFQAGDFVLNSQLLPFQIGESQVVGMRAMGFFLDGCFEIRVFLLQLLDMRIEIHPLPSAFHRARGRPWSAPTAARLLEHKRASKSAVQSG